MTKRKTCPACPDGYAFVQIALATAAPGGVSVQYGCWHGLEVEPPPSAPPVAEPPAP